MISSEGIGNRPCGIFSSRKWGDLSLTPCLSLSFLLLDFLFPVLFSRYPLPLAGEGSYTYYVGGGRGVKKAPSSCEPFIIAPY